ncbi:GTP cyclohydrolase FolE2 [Serratia sp. AKBS12]|uniref:GTP cyclohydrolase FolE2 n=1 Tax=Serratia sp. AKBS12 TaxID=2974597 RepID=UPI0021665FEC|nr:GTP cyclohydrolase FolE2 [Serratia sp. AKBS12]MCS3408572.1 GTP cyclohydrolase FolE2 [Serratia sp. AKBS12]
MEKTDTSNLPPLPDVQAWRAEQGLIGLDWVGMQGIALPLELAGRPLAAQIDASINLRGSQDGARGIHMSRLYAALDGLTQGELTPQRIATTLREFLHSQPAHSDRARLSINGELLLSRPALVSAQRGWKSYPLCIEAQLATAPRLTLKVGVPYSSTCPSSAALSRQAAQQQFLVDFDLESTSLDRQRVAEWLGVHGMPATPHSQRSWAWVTVELSCDEPILPVVELIERIEHALGTPVQTLVKRLDEQAFALANGHNLMFCEDAVRRLYGALRASCRYRACQVMVEHQESLHAHNAVAQLSWQEDDDVA